MTKGVHSVLLVLTVCCGSRVSAQSLTVVRVKQYDAAGAGIGGSVGAGFFYLFPGDSSGPSFRGWTVEGQYPIAPNRALRAQCGRDRAGNETDVFIHFQDVRRCDVSAVFYDDPWPIVRTRGYAGVGVGLYRYRLYEPYRTDDGFLTRPGLSAVAGIAQPLSHIVGVLELSVHMYGLEPQWRASLGIRWHFNPS